MLRSKELREKRAKLVADARSMADAVTDGASMTPEVEAKFDEMMAGADKLKLEIDRIERLETIEDNLGQTRERRAGRENVSPDEIEERDRLENSAFNAYLRGGMAAMNDEQRAVAASRIQASQGTNTNTGGGYTVAPGFFGKMIDAQLAFGGMLQLAYVFDTETATGLPVPTDNDTSNEGAILGENTPVTTQDVTFGAVTFNGYTYSSKLVLVSNQLLNDSAFNLDDFLSGKLGTRLARITNRHFTVGTGANQPTGVVTAATLGTTGTTGETASIIFDDLIELEHSVDPAYRTNANFMMADGTLKVIKKLKDNQGRPLWIPGYAIKEPDTINGYGYNINQHMPVMAANAKSVAFGDFSNYYIRRVAGAQVLRLTERYADANQTGFLAFQRWDGNLVDAGTHPVKVFQNSAS